MMSGSYKFLLGNWKCFSLKDGEHDYDVEDMVCNIPRSVVEDELRASNLPVTGIYTPYTHLFVDTGNHRILVDTGGGDLAPNTGHLGESMAAAGIDPKEINSVFITHAHPDHIGGVVDAHGELGFPNATIYINKTEWDYWFTDLALAQTGEWMTSFIRKKLAPIHDQVVTVEPDSEILPGVRVLDAPGHTPGHMVVSFSNGEEQLMYSGDTVLHPLHLEHPDWKPILDIIPEKAETSKQRIFKLAASTGCWVMAQQFPPFPSLGKVIRVNDHWQWQPVQEKKAVSI